MGHLQNMIPWSLESSYYGIKWLKKWGEEIKGWFSGKITVLLSWPASVPSARSWRFSMSPSGSSAADSNGRDPGTRRCLSDSCMCSSQKAAVSDLPVLLCRGRLALQCPTESWGQGRIPLKSLNSLGFSKLTGVRLLGCACVCLAGTRTSRGCRRGRLERTSSAASQRHW